MTQALKQKRCLAAIREGARVPSGSSNAKTRDDDELGWNRRGSWSDAGINPLPPINLRWPSLRPLCCEVLQPQQELRLGLPSTWNSAPLGLDLRCPVLLARSTTSPPKLCPLPKAPWPVKRPGLLLVSEGSSGSSDAVVNASCPPGCPPLPFPMPPSLLSQTYSPLLLR